MKDELRQYSKKLANLIEDIFNITIPDLLQRHPLYLEDLCDHNNLTEETEKIWNEIWDKTIPKKTKRREKRYIKKMTEIDCLEDIIFEKNRFVEFLQKKLNRSEQILLETLQALDAKKRYFSTHIYEMHSKVTLSLLEKKIITGLDSLFSDLQTQIKELNEK